MSKSKTPEELIIMARIDRMLANLDAKAKTLVLQWLASKHGSIPAVPGSDCRHPGFGLRAQEVDREC